MKDGRNRTAFFSIKHLWDLFGRKVSEWNDVNNSMDLARALHKTYGRGSEAHLEHDETLWGA